MAYDINGRAFDPSERDDSMLVRAIVLVIAALLIIAAACFVMGDAPRETADTPDTSVLTVDTSNTAEMHRWGMPTKADVMEWHMTGQWGYRAANSYYVYADLPGDSLAWDELYGIDGGNPAFDK